MPQFQSRPQPSPIAYPRAAAVSVPYAARLPYLRKVYALFTGGVGFAILGGLLALYAGTPVEVQAGAGVVALPPLVAFGVQHYFLAMLAYFGAFFVASAMRRTPGLNVFALLGYTFVTGLFVAPSIFFAHFVATHGASLDTSPVRDAFLLTGAAFSGLTSYVFVSKRDFSFLGASLSMGLWVVLGAMLLGFFVHSAALSLAVASVGVLLFSGYILYDTSRLLHDPVEDAVSAALRLFLDVVNLFLFLLRILSSNRSR
jgi:modulator of FtsH protease